MCIRDRVSSGFWLQHLCEAGASLREGNRLIVQAMNGRIKGRLDNGVDIDGKSNLGGTANRLKKRLGARFQLLI